MAWASTYTVRLGSQKHLSVLHVHKKQSTIDFEFHLHLVLWYTIQYSGISIRNGYTCPLWLLKHWYCLSRYLQWSWHLYCERFYACAYDAMAARAAEQWSWIDYIFCQDYGAVSWWYTMCQVTPHCLLTSRRTQASWKGTKLLTLLFLSLWPGIADKWLTTMKWSLTSG